MDETSKSEATNHYYYGKYRAQKLFIEKDGRYEQKSPKYFNA